MLKPMQGSELELIGEYCKRITHTRINALLEPAGSVIRISVTELYRITVMQSRPITHNGLISNGSGLGKWMSEENQ